jgi:predicted RNA-binding Zn ribbon-like protein
MSFEFIADRPVLDFVATISERGRTNEEKLQTPADLAQWVSQSRIVDDRLSLGDADLQHARRVREAAFGLLSALINGTEPHAGDLDLVNRAASSPRPVLQLADEGAVRRHGGLDAVLAVLACDCLDLFDSPDRDALHWCADTTCTRPFIDRSRGQRRRWCGMQGCGDRAKAAAYRQRRRARSGETTAPV